MEGNFGILQWIFLVKKWMINRYLEFVNDSNNVYKIKADAGIKIRSAWHTCYNILTIKCQIENGGVGN